MTLEAFCQVFHAGVTGKNHLGFENNNLIAHQFKKPKKSNNDLVKVLQEGCKQFLSFEGSLQKKMVIELDQLLKDVDNLKVRYEKRIETVVWKIKRIFFLVLEKIKICPKNPIKQHEAATFEALAAFRVKVEAAKIQALNEPAADFESPDDHEVALFEMMKEYEVELKPDVEKTPEVKVEPVKNNIDAEKLGMILKKAFDVDLVKKRLIDVIEPWGAAIEAKSSSNILEHYRISFLNALGHRTIDEGFKLLNQDLKELDLVKKYMEAEKKPEDIARVQLLNGEHLFEGFFAKILKNKSPVDVKDLNQLKLSDLNATYPKLIEALTWIGSKEPLILDASDLKELKLEELENLAICFPVIESLNLKGTNITCDELMMLIPKLPYLKELVVDEGQVNELVKNALAVFCLQDVKIGDELVKADFEEEEGVMHRHLPYVTESMKAQFDEIDESLKLIDGMEDFGEVFKQRVMKRPLHDVKEVEASFVLGYIHCANSPIKHGLESVKMQFLNLYQAHEPQFKKGLSEMQPVDFNHLYRALKANTKAIIEKEGFMERFNILSNPLTDAIQGIDLSNLDREIIGFGTLRLTAEIYFPELGQSMDNILEEVNLEFARKIV